MQMTSIVENLPEVYVMRLKTILTVVLFGAMILRTTKPKMITQSLGEGILYLIPKIIGMFL